LVIPQEKTGFSFLPGDNLIPGTANMPFLRKRKMMKELEDLDADYVIMDLGAGSSYNTVDMFTAGALGFIVAIPEPTSILNAYSFLKTAVYRLMSQAFKAKSPERLAVHQFFCKPAAEEGGSKGLELLLKSLIESNPKAGERVQLALSRLQPRVVINMLRSSDDANLAARLRQVCGKQLDVRVAYVALTPWDDAVRQSVINRKLIMASEPENPYSKAIDSLAKKILSEGFLNFHPPLEAFDDLESLLEE